MGTAAMITKQQVQAVIAELPPDLQESISGPSFVETTNAIFDSSDTEGAGTLREQQVLTMLQQLYVAFGCEGRAPSTDDCRDVIAEFRSADGDPGSISRDDW